MAGDDSAPASGPIQPPPTPESDAQSEEDLRSFSERYAGTQWGQEPGTGIEFDAPRPKSRMRLVILGTAVVALVAVMSVTLVAGAGPIQRALTPIPPPTLPPPIDPAPTLDPGMTALGKGVPIQCVNGKCLVVSVDDVSFVSRFFDPAKLADDVPVSSGKIFMAVHVTYKATAPRAAFDGLDWDVNVDGIADADHASVLHGPRPVLLSGRVQPGKTAGGWMVYEVPMTGKITISYEPALSQTVFKVVLRQG